MKCRNSFYIWRVKYQLNTLAIKLSDSVIKYNLCLIKSKIWLWRFIYTCYGEVATLRNTHQNQILCIEFPCTTKSHTSVIYSYNSLQMLVTFFCPIYLIKYFICNCGDTYIKVYVILALIICDYHVPRITEFSLFTIYSAIFLAIKYKKDIFNIFRVFYGIHETVITRNILWNIRNISCKILIQI